MVSFSCEVCNDVVKKPKLDSHKGQCRGAYFTCIDCNTTFNGGEYKGHTSCISEAQKYQGALYKPEKGKGKKGKQITAAAAPTTEPVLEKKSEDPIDVEMADATPAPVEPSIDEKPLTKEEKKEKAEKANKERKDRRKAAKEDKPIEAEGEVVAVVVEEAKVEVTKEIEAMPKKGEEGKEGRKERKERKKEKKDKKRKAEEVTQELAPIAEPGVSTTSEESKEVLSSAKKDKKDKKDKRRKIEETPLELATTEAAAIVESGGKEASPVEKPKKEKAPKVTPEDQAIGNTFIALLQKGHPLTFAKALARLEKEHGADSRKKLFDVLKLKKVKEDVVLSVI